MAPRSKKLRIAYGRISQESNYFSPVRTTLDDFKNTHYHVGEDVEHFTSPLRFEMKGFLRNAELSGFMKAMRQYGGSSVETIPLFSAWAVPGGPLTDETFNLFLERLRCSLMEAGKVDAVYLCLHGAMCAEKSVQPEVDFLREVRSIVGPKVPICISLDLHAQLTDEIFRLTDIVVAYRTNPHRDHGTVGFRAGKLLLDTVVGSIHPTTSWRSLPMLTGGRTTVDFLPSMRSIYRRMGELERDPRVLYVSVFNGHLWHGSKELGWGVVVVTDNHPALAERLVDELAEEVWKKRKDSIPPFPDAVAAIEEARASKLARKIGAVCMCDASDVVGAGGTGENTRLLRAFLEHGKDLVTYLPIRAPDVVSTLWETPANSPCTFRVGGQIDPHNNAPVECEGIFMNRREHSVLGRGIMVKIGNLYLVITERAPIAMAPKFYRYFGLSSWKADVVVVKSFFPFRLYFAAQNRKSIYVKTQGITDFDIVKEASQADPVYPLSDVQCWREIDARRRGVLHKHQHFLEEYQSQNLA